MQYVFPQINVEPALHLPKLKHLELLGISISKEDMERLLPGCTTLESLQNSICSMTKNMATKQETIAQNHFL